MKNNIHILSTNKPGRLHFTEFEEELVFTPKYEKLNGVNIYITADEEIKPSDYYLWKNKEVIKANDIQVSFHPSVINDCKKIILTTDQDLIKDGVQAIDDEFLEWFVKNPSCEEVEAESGLFFYRDGEDIRYKIIIPKQEPKKVLTEEDIFNQKDIDAVTDYINKEQQKQHLIDMMESDEELGLYDESREIKLKDVFNDEKRENIKKFIDEINNPSQPNDKLKQAFEKYSEYLEDYENKNTYEHGFKDGAKWQQEQYTIEEQHVGHTIDELDKEYIKGFNEGSNYYIERMYSEEDMEKAFEAGKVSMNRAILKDEGYDLNSYNLPKVNNFGEWFEKFKKK